MAITFLVCWAEKVQEIADEAMASMPLTRPTTNAVRSLAEYKCDSPAQLRKRESAMMMPRTDSQRNRGHHACCDPRRYPVDEDRH